MCGRFVSSSPPDEIAKYFDAEQAAPAMEPNFNVAPTSDVYAVYEAGDKRMLDAFYWGLIPSWAKDIKIGSKLTNARSETAATKNAFRSSLAKRRCVLPVDSFYEWKQLPGVKKKQPFRIYRPDGEPFAMASLWSEWSGSVGGEDVTVRSVTMLTGPPNEKMSELHHRMPIILQRDDWDEWLDPTVRDTEQIGRLMVPAPSELIDYHPVSTEVNSARNAGSHLIEAVPLPSPDSDSDGAGEGQLDLG